jgi:hypothetical protein
MGDFEDSFRGDERAKRDKINILMDDWGSRLADARVWDGESQKYFSGKECFCRDGFYPGYFNQPLKILFVGRETVQMWGGDYIASLFDAYHRNEVAGVTVNRHAFHSRMLYIAYGALHGGSIAYDDLPWASDIAKTFGRSGGISFAFMELSKYSNEADDANSHCNKGLMEQFLRDSDLVHRNFVKEELEILQPDIIFTMNLWECGIAGELIENALGKVTTACGKPYLPYATLNRIAIRGRQTPLIDMFHFSSRKSHKKAFYDPAMTILKDTGLLTGSVGKITEG